MGAFRRNGAVVIDVANLASRLSWFQAMPLESKLFLSKDLEKIRILGAIFIFFFFKLVLLTRSVKARRLQHHNELSKDSSENLKREKCITLLSYKSYLED